GAVLAHRGHVETLDDLEGLEVLHAATRQWRAVDVVAAVIDRNWGLPGWLVGGEVLFGQQPAVLLRETGDLLRDRATIEGIGPISHDHPEGARQIGLLENRARFRR